MLGVEAGWIWSLSGMVPKASECKLLSRFYFKYMGSWYSWLILFFPPLTFLVCFKDFGLWPTCHGANINVFKLVQSALHIRGFCICRYGGLAVLCRLMQRTWASTDLGICMRRGGPGANPSGISRDDCSECSGLSLPFSLFPMLPSSLSPHLFQGPLTLFWVLLQWW